MFSKKVYFATVIVLGLGSVLNIIGRFSPWMFSVHGPNIYNAQKNKVVHGTINFGWFFLEACDGSGCYIQSMSERYNDHSQYANASTVSLFAETWYARRKGEQTIEALAFISNVAGTVFCGLILYGWKSPMKHVYGALSATCLLISSALEWGNLGEVMAEMGSFLRYKDSKTTLYTPASFVLSLLGATALLFVSTVYYLGVMHTIFAHTDDDTKRFLFTDKSTIPHKGENGNIEHSTNHNNETFQNTSDQSSV